jgi:hypothetical protein
MSKRPLESTIEDINPFYNEDLVLLICSFTFERGQLLLGDEKNKYRFESEATKRENGTKQIYRLFSTCHFFDGLRSRYEKLLVMNFCLTKRHYYINSDCDECEQQVCHNCTYECTYCDARYCGECNQLYPCFSCRALFCIECYRNDVIMIGDVMRCVACKDK